MARVHLLLLAATAALALAAAAASSDRKERCKYPSVGWVGSLKKIISRL